MATTDEVAQLEQEWRLEQGRQVTRILQRLASVSSLTMEDLIKPGRVREASFDNQSNNFRELLRWRDLIQSMDLEVLPPNTLSVVTTVADRIATALLGAVEFDPAANIRDWQQLHNKAFKQIQAAVEGITGGDASHLAIALASQLTAPRNLLANFKELADLTMKQINNELNQAGEGRRTNEEALSQTTSLLTQLRSEVQEAAIAKEAQVFAKEADANSKAADQWLIAVGISAAVAFTVGLLSVIPATWPDKDHAIPGTAGRIILFSVVLSAALWTGRVYRAYRHNQAVNRHRANALATFQIFAESAKGDHETRSFILRQATSAIFAPQPTAFSPSDGESASQAVPWLEILHSNRREQ
jgi:ElaB/YqjD/DUF883 family membrane-anchored ribosome-binding protein